MITHGQHPVRVPIQCKLYAGASCEVLDELGMLAAPKQHDARVPQKSCQRMSGSLARLSSGLKCRLTTFCTATEPPCDVERARGRSSATRVGHLVRSSSWR
jgi:hypothetical protein